MLLAKLSTGNEEVAWYNHTNQANTMSNVISDQLRELNKQLHENDSRYGNREDGAGLGGNLPKTLERMKQLGVCNTLLDYGTGKGKLVEKLRNDVGDKIKIDGYDPAIEKWSKRPKQKYDIITCLDVLEHIEMSSIDAVLKEISDLTGNFCYLVIDLQPAVKVLADGRNAHILLAPCDWWVSKIAQIFPCQASFPVMHERGIPQKLIIAASHRRDVLPYMYSFLMKMKLFDLNMSGGVLGKRKKKNKV